ncbi:MAG: hypothetical protein K9J12_07850 [Melioribacteraceae bacterium]|nr:hypothetical protein [Melioribacteraceae bacterium]MCF8265187.1 hypothetical protein [Melioribacteraceae bacterium]MCF8413758.1 hypothetical protein [Melioribacteraceae bacterium]MCF8431130.1 hypothetical protein [Melioribacteraceae bacterium]
MIRFVFFAFLFLNSCDLFVTREPESPDSGSQNFNAAVVPEILFDNLVTSFKEKKIEYYQSCFLDTLSLNREFQFIPTADAANKYSAFADWNLSSEEVYFRNLISEVEESIPISLVLSNELVVSQGEVQEFQFDYSIVVIDQNALTNIFSGIIRITIEIDNRQQWVITKWEDSKISDELSWSDLKGIYY